MTENTNSDDDEELETNYLAIGPTVWGSSEMYESDALKVMLEQHYDYDSDETYTVMLYTVRGDWGITGLGGVSADEIVDAEHLRMDGALLKRASDLLGDADIAVEEALVEAETVEDDDE